MPLQARRGEADPRAWPAPPALQNNESTSADQVKKNSAGFAAPLGCQPPMDKEHHRASLKSQRERERTRRRPIPTPSQAGRNDAGPRAQTPRPSPPSTVVLAEIPTFDCLWSTDARATLRCAPPLLGSDASDFSAIACPIICKSIINSTQRRHSIADTQLYE
jgi:hypothetical protein